MNSHLKQKTPLGGDDFLKLIIVYHASGHVLETIPFPVVPHRGAEVVIHLTQNWEL